MNIFEGLDVGGPVFLRGGLYAYGGINGFGGVFLPYSAKTGTATLTSSDYVVEATSGTFTVTLPSAVGVGGQIYIIKNNGTGSVTVAPAGSEKIDGYTTAILKPGHSCITIQSNGINWIAIGVISPVQMS